MPVSGLRGLIVLRLASCLLMGSMACTTNPQPPLLQELQVVPVLESLPLDRPNELAFFTERDTDSPVHVTLASRDSYSLTALIEGSAARGPGRVICIFSRVSEDIRCLVQAGRITDDRPPPGFPLEYASVDLQSAEIKLSSLDWHAGSTVGVSFRLVADGGRLIRGFARGIVVGPDSAADR